MLYTTKYFWKQNVYLMILVSQGTMLWENFNRQTDVTYICRATTDTGNSAT